MREHNTLVKEASASSVHTSDLFHALWQQLPQCDSLSPSPSIDIRCLLIILTLPYQLLALIPISLCKASNSPKHHRSCFPHSGSSFHDDQLCLDSNLHEGKGCISFTSQFVQSQPSLESSCTW